VKYLVMMTNVDDAWDRLAPAEQRRILDAHEAVTRALTAEGKLVASHRLRPAREARTIRMEDDGRIGLHDGPFGETKEVVGGYYVLECESIDEAVEWARRLRFMPGSNEVRAVWE
jgi:hypothetical protein